MILPQKYKAKLVEKTQLSQKVYKLVLEVLEPQNIEFKAGQFLMLQINDSVKRAYSIASSPSCVKNKPCCLELFVDLAPGGPASQFFENVQTGVEMQFSAPYGAFGFHDSPNEKIFIAGSTGAMPMRSMILDYLENPTSLKLRRVNSPVTLFFAVSHVADLFLVDEFRNLEITDKSFHYVPIVTRPEKEWNGVSGPVINALDQFIKDTSGKDFYICGAPGMVPAIRQYLIGRGVKQENIFNEKY